MADYSGQTIGKYELRERLGRGGMADVYKAYQPSLDRFVAVKIIHDTMAESPEFIERFKREAQSIAGLRHNNILQVIDFDVDGDLNYMVMEYIQGGTLKDYLIQKGVLKPYEMLVISKQLADALAYAHDHGMVHRDVKPANVMFTDKSYSHTVLTDFGIAKLVDATNLTASGMMVGTPTYMSPETGRGENVDTRADIYSLGVMMYEMVTGSPPFVADAPYAVILKHISDSPPPIRHKGESIPQAVEALILKALAKSPDDRHATAAELRDAIAEAQEAALHARTTAVRTDKPATPASPTAPTDKLAKTRRDPPKQPAQKTPARPNSSNGFLLGMGAMAILVVLVVAVVVVLSNRSNEESTPITPDALPTRVAQDEVGGPADSTPTEDPQPTAITTGVPDEDDGDVQAEVDEIYSQFWEGDQDAAFEQVDAAIDANPDVGVFYELRGWLHLWSDDLDDAEQDFKDAIAREPENGDAYHGLGHTLMAMGAPEEAIANFDRALAISPDPQIYQTQANAYMMMGDVETADDVLSAGVNAFPDDLDVLLTRGMLRRDTGNPEAALADFEQIIAAEPDFADAWRELAATLVVLDDLESAEAAILRAIEIDPERADFYYTAGEGYYSVEEFERALEAFDEGVRLSDDDPWMLWMRAKTRMQLRDFEGAIEDLQKAIDIDPHVADFYVTLASIFAGPLEQPERASAVIQRGSRANAGDPWFAFEIGNAMWEFDAQEQAIEMFERAVSLEDDNPNFILRLADAYYEVDRREDALALYQRFVDLIGGEADDWIQERIDELGS